MVETMGESTL